MITRGARTGARKADGGRSFVLILTDLARRIDHEHTFRLPEQEPSVALGGFASLGGSRCETLRTFRPGTVVPFSRQMADIASQAFQRFGRQSGHPARLNYGDCMAYAVSAAQRAPLLFKGGDSGRTDALSHPASIRA
jgi:hypothetical protein